MNKVIAVDYPDYEIEPICDDYIILDNISDINKYKSDILIINLDIIPDLYDELNYYDNLKYEKFDLYEYDRLNRYKYKNYKKVYVVSIDEFFLEYNYKNIYSNLFFINNLEEIDLKVKDINNISNIKKGNIIKLKEYVDKQKDYFDSKNIMKKFNVSNRWVKRYMKDMNDIYNNIGYSYVKRKWYKTKER